MTALAASRSQVLRFRAGAQQLDAAPGATLADCAVLDLGVQDTGPDGAAWALALRGVDARDPAGLALAWTLRGGPHLYRRGELADVATAVSPFSEADAARRIFDASKPLRAAGRAVLDALDELARTMREIVRGPMVKGEVSTALTARTGPELHRFCRPCNATHLYENPFRLSALFAGLELEPGTSPPVLRPVPGWPQDRIGPSRPGPTTAPEHLQVVPGYLRLLGPASPKDVAVFLDAPVADVKAHWPADAVEVDVDGRKAWLLEGDLAALADAATAPTAAERAVRLLGPYDLFLQARDREVLVPDAARHKELWPVLGRPGAVVVDGEVLGTWRPRAQGRRLTVRVAEWTPWDARTRTGVDEQAERLAAHRGVRLAAVETA